MTNSNDALVEKIIKSEFLKQSFFGSKTDFKIFYILDIDSLCLSWTLNCVIWNVFNVHLHKKYFHIFQ